MRILIASDKFKGSLTAAEANRAIAGGLLLGNPDLDIETIPIADGGDGLVATIVSATNGTTESIVVSGPLEAKTNATIGFLPGGKTAVIEMAEASGIALLQEGDLKPDIASTYGTGEMIQHALSLNCSRIILGIGGSATNDGGAGMARALGYRFLDQEGAIIENLPEELLKVTSIEPPEENTFPEVLVACDVTNPLLGPDGCTRIYGPQKGILPEQFDRHESRLAHLADLCGEPGSRAARLPGSGAAGGLGFGSIVFLNGKLVPGFDLVADLLDLEQAVKRSDLVITGEGSLDEQSLKGKGPGSLARMAASHRKPAVAFCGKHELTDNNQLFRHVSEISDKTLTLEENMSRAFELLRMKASEFSAEHLSSIL